MKKSLPDKLELYHVSKIENHDKIMEDGLTLNNKPSGYGEIPKHKAVYLYHKNNIDVPCDMLDLFGVIDVYKVYIKDFSKLIPDEDSNMSTWVDSLECMGTVAYKDNIPKEDIVYMGRITKND